MFKPVKIQGKEKVEWINGLARIYCEQGYKILDKFPFTNEIKHKISEVTGLHYDTVTVYLRNEFKQQISNPTISEPKLSASVRVEHELGSGVKDRFEEEVKQKLEAEYSA